ncbi:MAG: terminase small subunit [Oscillospiraceae bacterium]|nr:terminase small subunit [Oscillospiraceae bacterium]
MQHGQMKKKGKKRLSAKEQSFCDFYRRTRNGREAAALAGYRANPQHAANKLLGRREIQRALARGGAPQAHRAEVMAGYRRLAFGAGTDALKLLFLEEAPGQEFLETLDIFNVCDIKRPKGGGLEIKFFDRCEALQRLEAFCGAADGQEEARCFYEALERSVGGDCDRGS